MTMQPGKDILLKIEDPQSPGTYLTVGGLKNTNISFNNQAIDVTTKDSAGYQEFLGGSGRKTLSISGQGMFTGSSSEILLRNTALACDLANYRIELGNGEIISGAFMITSYERSGDQDSEEEYAVSLSSSGSFDFS